MSNSQKPNVCVVTKPSTEDSYAEPIYNFCTILQPSADDLYLISGDTVLQDSRADRIKGIGLSDGSYTGQRYLDFVLIQFHICYQLLRLRKRIDLVYFHKGVMALALPVLFARLLHVKSCVIKLSDFYSNRDLTRYSSTYISIVSLLQWLSFWSADAAVVFSEQEVDSVPTECVFVSFSNYIDFDTFTIETPISERKFDIGFVGRFTEIKGVELFVEAAKEIIKDNPDTHVVLIGDGPLLDTIKQSVTDIEQIQLYGWIDYEQLPNKYNQIQFLFAPSKSEGLPTVLLEAMVWYYSHIDSSWQY